MAYVVPQVLVFQEFTAVPDELTNPLRAWIAGGHADLHRYAVTDEKAEVSLGAYDKDFDAAYSWPGRTAGSLVDADYVKLFVDDAILEYCNLPAGNISLSAVSGENNQISGTAVFADNGTAYPRDLENKASGGTVVKRDVKVGDIVDIDDGEGNSRRRMCADSSLTMWQLLLIPLPVIPLMRHHRQQPRWILAYQIRAA